MCAAQKSCVVNGHSNLNMCSLGIYCTELEDIPCGHLVNAKRKKELHPSFTFHFIHTSAHFVSSLLCDTPRESRSGWMPSSLKYFGINTLFWLWQNGLCDAMLQNGILVFWQMEILAVTEPWKFFVFGFYANINRCANWVILIFIPYLYIRVCVREGVHLPKCRWRSDYAGKLTTSPLPILEGPWTALSPGMERSS